MAAALLVVFSLAACSSPGPSEAGAQLDRLLGFDLLAPSQFLDPQAVGDAERDIAACMRGLGFEYFAESPEGPRGPSVGDRSYVEVYGYGVTTTYYLAEELPAYLLGSTDASLRVGERNQAYRQGLGELERAAYERALEGAPPSDDGVLHPGCESEAYQRFDRQTVFVDNFGDVYLELVARINADARIVRAAEAASACLQRQGVPFASRGDLTDHLHAELRRLDSVGVDNFGRGEFQALSHLQDLEVGYANSVLRCREETGLIGDLYEAVAAEYKASFLEENHDVLQSVFGKQDGS